MAYELKQVIVVRHDLHMRAGKIAAQAAHASISFLTRRIQSGRDFTKLQLSWINGSFAKVCLRVESEQELLEIEQKALNAGLECHLITDAGRTEFHGVPTRTCLAIGPDKAEVIDSITGKLKLL
jgi:PTH2 family peptidyl-tRNA hydrolase